MTTPSAPDGPVFTAPHVAAPVGTLLSPLSTHDESTPRERRPLGAWALVLAVVAAVPAPAVAGFAGFRVARGAGPGLETMSSGAFDWRVLSPVREWVLLGEVSFWTGSVLGILALVLGIMGIARKRGRGAGIAAVIVAAIGPIVFAALVAVALAAGLAAGVPAGTSV